MKADVPELLHSQHFLEKEHHRLHRERVRSDVIDRFDGEAVPGSSVVRCDRLEARCEARKVGPLDEPERQIAERRGDLYAAKTPAGRVPAFGRVGQECRASLVQKAERGVEVVHA
jgi:hypothetical protein